MKLTTILLLAAVLQVSARSNAQTVTYEAKSVSLEKLFSVIKQQTGFVFFYRQDDLAKTFAVSVSFKNTPLQKALDEILQGQKLSYNIQGKAIFIILSPANTVDKEDEKLNTPPPIDIKGRIVNENSEGVAANILVKGTQNGTASTSDGYFELKGVHENATLVVTGVSIETVEIKVNGKADLTISVKTAIKPLEETFVRGYYTEKKLTQVGNVSKVDAKTIEKQPVANPLQALQGRMPGVYIKEQSGIPGGMVSIQIRGQNSLRNTVQDNGNVPLFIVDGVPFTSTSLNSPYMNLQYGSSLMGINPADIESVEVLKDADATAIYGSRGANGVVLITTKKGRAGKTKVDVNFYSGIAKVAHKMELLNTQQYLEMRKEGYSNEGITIPTNSRTNDLKRWDSTRYTDWQKALIGNTANQTNAQVSLSGGNVNTQFLISGGYLKQTYVYPGDAAFNRGSAHFSINHISGDKRLQANVSATYISNNNDLNDDLTLAALTLSPNAPALFQANGDLNWENSTWTNPLSILKVKYRNITDNLNANGSFSYEIAPGLRLKTALGYNSMQTKEFRAQPISSRNPATQSSVTGNAIFGDSYNKTWIVEPQIDYIKTIGKGKLNVLVGTTFQQSVQQGQTIQATGYTSDALLENILGAVSKDIIGTNYFQYRHAAVFARLGYNWSEKYLLNITARRDGSSRFGPGKQFGNFGAIGTGWIFSNENFIKNNWHFLSYGKLRTSYGTNGNDAINDYQYLNTYSSTTYPYNGSTGLVMTRLDNADFSWETNKKLEAGIELGFIQNRILLAASWYRNRSSNQLVGLPLPVITGQSSVQYNFPATVENRGWEFEFSIINIKGRNFQWSTNFNLTLPKNELIAFPNIAAFPAYNNLYQVGKSVYIKRTLKYNGIDPQTGVYTFQDVNADGNISTADDGMFLKEIAQKYYGGLNNTLKYKGFQFDVFFQFVKQTGLSYITTFLWPGGSASNQPLEVADRWQRPGDIAKVQKYSAVFGNAAMAYFNLNESDELIVDASFIRLKNVSLTWDIPSKWLQKAKMQNGKFYLRGQNLFTITNYLGLDPENTNYSTLPPLRVITAGFQLTF